MYETPHRHQQYQAESDPDVLRRQRRPKGQGPNQDSRERSQWYKGNHRLVRFLDSNAVFLSLHPSPFVDPICVVSFTEEARGQIVVGKICIELLPCPGQCPATEVAYSG